MDPTTRDDDDLEAAIALSLAPDASQAAHSSEMHSFDNKIETQPTATRPVMGLAGLDRQAMERERLARLSKRKREPSISPPPTRKAPKLETTTLEMPSGAKLNMFSTTVQHEQASRKSGIANAATEKLKGKGPQAITTAASHPSTDTTSTSVAAHGEIVYPTGVVKKTWAFGHPRTANDIKLEEVLEARTLRTAFLSAFQWDVDWVLSKLRVPPNGGSTKCIFAMQEKYEDKKQEMLKQSEHMRPFLRLCFPPMPGQVHCMHSKLMLLFHPKKLRVAIPTANLLNFDWGETGVMENSVFIIDLPRLPNDGKIVAEELTFFGKELLYFLQQQGVDQNVQDGLLNFDFGATLNMAFVHTVGGITYRDDAARTGLPGLGRAVRHLGLQTDDLDIDFAASSIGNLKDDFLRVVHSAARGEDLIAKSTAAMSSAKSNFFKPSASKKGSQTLNIREKLRIYFPTKETVISSTAGGAGTICTSRKWYEDMPFPRSCFRDYVSVRPGLLSHNKILYARGKRKQGNNEPMKDVAWAYVGSSNLSESAWGKLVDDKKEKCWKLNCRNWECGVILPVPNDRLRRGDDTSDRRAQNIERKPGEDSETESEDEKATPAAAAIPTHTVGMDVFEGLVDLPFEYPGRKYDGREPWYFQERA